MTMIGVYTYILLWFGVKYNIIIIIVWIVTYSWVTDRNPSLFQPTDVPFRTCYECYSGYESLSSCHHSNSNFIYIYVSYEVSLI